MSGRKNAIPAYKLVSDQSLAGGFESDPVTLATATHIGFNVATDGVTENTGSFGVEHRVYKDENFFSDWAELTLSAVPTLAGVDRTFLMDVTVPPGQVRMFFDQTAIQVQTLTFPTLVGAAAGDYIVFYDTTGVPWAIGLDKTGADPDPTGAAWVAVSAGRKTFVDISGATTAAQVAAAVEAAVDALTGFTAVITTSDVAADGTMTFTQVAVGGVNNAVPHNADDSGVGSITAANTSGPDGTCDVWISGDQV